MVNRRNLLWLIPVGLIITFPLWRLPLTSFLEPRGGFDPNFGKQDQTVHNFVMEKVIILQNQLGRKTAEIRADQALTTDVPNEFILLVVDADLFDEQGDLVNVKAKTGIYNTDTRQLTLRRSVHVTRVSQDQHLYSEEIFYYDNNRTIKSPGHTRLVGKNIEIEGESLDYDIVTMQYQVGGRVYCKIAGLANP